ncbi:MAG: ABC transporter ATP-binding protein [Thermoplasmata archaeon]
MDVETRIKARNILVKYGDVIALDSFSTNIHEGVVGILGPNGAGKTTFIKVLLGLVKPQSGRFMINGQGPTSEFVDIRDTVGFMPENDCLIGSMNAFEMVSYMGGLSGMVKDEAIQRGHEVLDFVGIGEERYRDIGSYSTGMKQRVKLAQAIVHDPEILMLDEPTNGMDPDGRKDMLDLISKIGRYGKTILVSSHLLHEVEQVCDHVKIINQGKLLREGSIKEILIPEEGQYRLKVRGTKESIHDFCKALRKNYELLRVVDERSQVDIVLKGVDKSKNVLESVKKTGVQIRYYRPDILSLEDVFLESFEGGGLYGN